MKSRSKKKLIYIPIIILSITISLFVLSHFYGFSESLTIDTVQAQSSDTNCPHDGDLNEDGKITIDDASLAFDAVFETSRLTPCQQDHADVNCDNEIRIDDVACIFNSLFGIFESECKFDCGEPSVNKPPVIGEIGDRNVDVGNTLSFTVTASDPNNDEISLFITPIPLPDNATFNCGTGLFAFTPNLTQESTSFQLTFMSSDGSLTDSETITVTVNTIPSTGITSLKGQILDANDAQKGIETPIVGAVVKNKETGRSTVTDSDGNFTLTGITSGVNHFEYDGSSVGATDGSSYGAYLGKKEIIGNVTNVINRPIYLMRIDNTGEVEVDPNNTTILDNKNLGITLTIPPNTVKDQNGNNYSDMLSISEVPPNFTPASLPGNLDPGMVVSIQPMGLTFDTPAPITLPNSDNLASGSEVNLWSLDHDKGEFFIAGKSKVSADGSVINTIEGGIREASWHFPMPSPPNPPQDPSDDPDYNNNNQPGCDSCNATTQLSSGSDIKTGNFFEDHTLASYRSLGVQREMRLFYNSTSAFPCPIIPTQIDLNANASLPNAISTNLKVGGVDLGNVTFKKVSSALTRQSVMFDATNVNIGLYNYFLEVKSHYESSTVSSTMNDNVIINNQINSPIGAGWTLHGIQRLYGVGRADGRVLLIEGDGSNKFFSLKTLGTGKFSIPTNFPVGISPSSVAAGDFNGDNVLDLATANLGSDNVSILIGDGTGNFSPPTNFPVGNFPFSIIADDFNGDNVIDIVTNGKSNNNNVSILIGDGTGNFVTSRNLQVVGELLSVTEGDFNGDNVLDLATAVREPRGNGNVSILIGDGTGNFETAINFPVRNISGPVIAGDFNGNNVLDLAVIINPGGNMVSISILIGDGTGNFSPPTSFLVGGSNPGSVTAGDFNGDNVLDLAIVVNQIVSILIGDGTGNFSPPTNFPVGNFPFSIIADDFNGDNVIDLATTNLNSDNVSILIGDGTGNFSAPTNFPVADDPASLIAGDFNGDNVLDLAIANQGSRNVSILIGEPIQPGAPPGDFSTIVQNDDGTFARTMKNGTQIHFDENGFHTSTVDRNGNTTKYTYDSNGLLTTITDPVGLVTTLSYQNGMLSSVTDPANRVTTFQHDANGNLTKIIDPDGSEYSYTYDNKHLMTSETDPNGNKHEINYSFAGRFQSMDFADGSSKQLSPSIEKGLVDISKGEGDSVENPAPNVLASEVNSTVTDGNGNVTTINTDNFGGVTASTDNCCLGRINNTERNDDGLPTKITRADGAVTTNTYDGNGNLLTSTAESIGATTQFTYDPEFNQVTSITDPNGNKTTITYDANGNPIEVVDAFDNKTTQTYNSQGLLTSVTNPIGNTTIFTYDNNGNLEKITDPLSNVSTLETDEAGNVIKSIDAKGNATQFSYDDMNRLVQTMDANNNVTKYSYDANGNLTQVIYANNNVTSFAYDSMDRLVTNTDPLGKSDTFTYDGNGNLVTTTDRKGQTINFQYDSINQLIKKTLPGNLVTNFSYDLTGNLKSVTDPDSKLAFTYDGVDRLTSVATTGSPNQPNVTINYTYDLNGNRKTMIDSLTGTTNYLYDALNSVTGITNPANQSVSFDYDSLSRRTLTTLPNGVTTDVAYDANNQLASLQHKRGATIISSFGYSYDDVGNRTSMNTTRTGVTVNNNLNYVYDDIYQLTQATRPLLTQSDETFSYDSLGNRLSSDGQTTNSTIGTANRLLDDTTFAYNYDDNGNLIQKVDKATNATTTYTYDAENQLIQISMPNGIVAKYRYDGLGRRIEKDVDGTITRYVYDKEDILMEFDGSNSKIVSYTHGLGIDEPLIMERDGSSFFYHTDGLGSITDLTDSSGAISQSYVYDSFGNIDQQVGFTVNPYTYTGREFDPESGLYYYRARYYNAEAGRFINEDPIGLLGGLNLYGYANNNSINLIDSFGLKTGPLGYGYSDVILPIILTVELASLQHKEGKLNARIEQVLSKIKAAQNAFNNKLAALKNIEKTKSSCYFEATKDAFRDLESSILQKLIDLQNRLDRLNIELNNLIQKVNPIQIRIQEIEQYFDPRPTA